MNLLKSHRVDIFLIVFSSIGTAVIVAATLLAIKFMDLKSVWVVG